MAVDHISDSDEDDSEIDIIRTPSPRGSFEGPPRNESTLSIRSRDVLHEAKLQKDPIQPRDRYSEDPILVIIPPPKRPWEYQPFRGHTTVDSVLEEYTDDEGEARYGIEYENGKKDDVPLGKLLKLANGRTALEIFYEMEDTSEAEQRQSEYSSIEPGPSRSKRVRDVVNYSKSYPFDIDDDSSDVSLAPKKRRLTNGRNISLFTNEGRKGTRISSRLSSRPRSATTAGVTVSDSESDSDSYAYARGPKAKRSMSRSTKNPRKIRIRHDESDELAGNEPESETSTGDRYVQPGYGGPTRTSSHRANNRGRGRRGRPRKMVDSSSSPEDRPEPSRRSGRDRLVKSMKEHEIDEELYADDAPVNNTPKIISIREVFQKIEKKSEFRKVHNQDCDVCGGTGDHSNKGISQLIYCQGCSSSIHKVCLGYRSAREHRVTKIGPENFVMQCRRCIGISRKKDQDAPHLDICQSCKMSGKSCKEFSPKKTSKLEEQLREENEGEDPVTKVSPALVNNAGNVLFRCTGCQRGWHFEHLPALSSEVGSDDVDSVRIQRLRECIPKWQCKTCLESPAKVQTLVAWRPVSKDAFREGDTAYKFIEDDREWLIKWKSKSYFACTWMPGAWVWGVTPAVMRKAFFARGEGENLLPRWTTKEAVPEEYLRMEIVFDVSYNSYNPTSEASDKRHVDEVDEVFVKFRGLGYDESVWESPPHPEQTDRYNEFVEAYEEYVNGKYFKSQPLNVLKERVDKFRSLNFAKRIEFDEQPSSLTGGKIMSYQKDGLNWLLYQYQKQKNVILADEMGLGKTIQVIALLASLINDKPKCWPFLIVTPNSTCPNWRREIKKWCPSLRVVTYYGAQTARDMAMQYELFPDGTTDMRAHIVVTSYEAPVSETAFFKKIKWAGMIVDEGQRLKNDENLLYGALKSLKVPFQLLLTGTPLQNNKRELFNLLQFLDPSMNAAELDEEYEELTKENLPRLHDLIRPFFLRRTKLQVLRFLPPMAQVILPVTMSVVQKQLYKSILAKNPQLIKSIFGKGHETLSVKDRGNLNNILMQLRKCLCHPFLYSSAIEEKAASEEELHRNLVNASSKFQLLNIMLPKLRDRGHRVLIFSQFLKQLDLVEDFLNGLDISFQRLDGTISTLEKQKRIDAYNAPGSSLFAFLLSTRAGGVGINLATADTVIIMDPDFNPHQDIQALSRAHRIGQKKKVLVFQLMTKDSAEEKIVQIGRKKMALDQALIESMDAEDDAGVDLESILKHGAAALFNNDDRNDIQYDSASVDKLLDRTMVENTEADGEKTAESQFSFARIWANDTGGLTDDIGDPDTEADAPSEDIWTKILAERKAEAEREAAKRLETFGRGKRAKQNVDYARNTMELDDEAVGPSPKPKKQRSSTRNSDIDGDFASEAESEGDGESDIAEGPVDPAELRDSRDQHRGRGILNTTPKGMTKALTTPSKSNPPSGKKRVATPRKATKEQQVSTPKLSKVKAKMGLSLPKNEEAQLPQANKPKPSSKKISANTVATKHKQVEVPTPIATSVTKTTHNKPSLVVKLKLRPIDLEKTQAFKLTTTITANSSEAATSSNNQPQSFPTTLFKDQLQSFPVPELTPTLKPPYIKATTLSNDQSPSCPATEFPPQLVPEVHTDSTTPTDLL